jgi:NAD(P)-dependent dehydrogenase (short-subunit alcohol dehydrogenase family)
MISHYAASKAALEHLTRCWAIELAPHRIRVNAVAPGPTETDILKRSGLPAAVVDEIKNDEAERVPLRRRGTAEEIAAWIVNLASSEASWITGQVIAVDGGLSVA